MNKGKYLMMLVILSVLWLLPAQGQDTLKIAFIGDVMCHERQLEYAFDSSSKTYNFDSYFSYMKSYLEDADFAVANMEFTVGVKPYTGYPCFSAPEALARETKNAGIDLFLTANNHICDKNRRGLDSTLAIYGRMEMPHTGIYPCDSVEMADNPFIVNIKGVNVAFLNFTYGLNGFVPPEPYRINMLDSVHIRATIARAKERGAQFIIAMPHWGEEYEVLYNPVQKKWEKFLYDEGVNAVIGSHPHVVQAVEYESGRLTVFSLGNYISNMSIKFGQIGMLVVMSLVVDGQGSIDVLPPQVTYLWCGRGGFLEENYTVVPIQEYLSKPEAFIQQSQYRKMVREWDELRKILKLENSE